MTSIKRQNVLLNSLDSIKGEFEAIGLEFKFRHQSTDEWRIFENKLSYCPASYSTAMQDYYKVYWESTGCEYIEFSLLILYNGKVCAIWPLSIKKNNGAYEIGSGGYELAPPLFHDVPQLTLKKNVSKCIESIKAIARKFGVAEVALSEGFTGCMGMSYWHQQIMKSAKEVSLQHEMFVDLELDFDQIKSKFRKSYKALINTAFSLWRVNLLEHADYADWEQFRNLHIAAAGRETRNKESWKKQLDAIAYGDAFLVYLTDHSGMMVGGGYFNLTKDEGLYSVGAYNRTLFDKPLGHLVQYSAIKLMKERGIRWYKLGLRPYKIDNPSPDDKFMQVSNFKEGFCNTFHPLLKVVIACE